MKLILSLALVLSYSLFATAQCSEFEIVMLQAIQRADAAQKESKIQSLGFDLYSTQNGRRIFHKCWKGNVDGKPVYEQKIILEDKSLAYTFLTLNQDHFMKLRSSIEERMAELANQRTPVFTLVVYFNTDLECRATTGMNIIRLLLVISSSTGIC